MIWTAWTNGANGFGMKISKEDRDQYFKREWDTVELELPQNDDFICCTPNINKKSFWTTNCGELIKKEIGDWLKVNNYYPWGDENPPQFEVKHMRDNEFRATGQI